MANTSKPPTPPLPEELEFAIQAARQAGERALQIRQSGRWHDKILADVGDQACDAYLQGLILGRYPQDGLLSEETKDTPDRLKKRRAWIVDPLDGTKEYMAGRDDWAVHVGLTVAGQCVLGAVALPSQGQTLWGWTGSGASAAGLEGEGSLISGDSSAPGRLRMAVSRSHTPDWVGKMAEELDAELVPAGSVGNKVSMLLQGRADLYVHKTGLKEWDTCAPEAVALAAGWTVSRLDGAAQVYNQADPYNDQMLVCRPADRTRVLEAIAASGALG
ncbi:MAG: 3'(2'),5'-bisphosphate nucleotidase CysQ [Planctomycetota bacterium]|nr:3'(2'),5'-bisphosphate nucleotidase CysQ [Planctomycetota bacterium]